MKIWCKFTVFTAAFLWGLLSSHLHSQTIVEAHGQLQVQGSKMKDECGRTVELRGMSFFWHFWDNSSSYINEEVVNWLGDDWKVQILRIPIGVFRENKCSVLSTAVLDTSDCQYGVGTGLTGKEFGYETARQGIEACIAQGVYVIIDWHSHNIWQEEAKEFFDTISKQYSDYPNLLYEIINEPDSETWDEVKEYAAEIITVIRENDPDNIILIGSPHWDQDLHIVAHDPLVHDSNNNPVSNIAYTAHFYAGEHKEWLRQRVKAALDQGLCVYVSECGTGWEETYHWDEWEAWMKFVKENNIGWCNWSLGIKNEIWSCLNPTASTKGNWDINKDLRESGRIMRNLFRETNEIPEPCDSVDQNPH